MALKDYEFWLIVGSQHLYGEETLRQVKEHAQIMTEGMNRSGRLPCSLVLKPVAKTPDEITEVMRAANADSRCAGVIVWMHTFSPSKMWIGGLSVLQKPYCHFATQFNRNIPNEGIDMDFMNLNQSAHGANTASSQRACVCRARSLQDTGKMQMYRKKSVAGCVPQ